VLLDAVSAFAPESITRLAKLKKADIASEAERLPVDAAFSLAPP
jgi:ParB family chromosome partitioning protein